MTTYGKIGLFRAAPAPRLAVPFGVRSVGHFTIRPGQRIDTPQQPRPMGQLYWGVAGEARFGTSQGEVRLHADEVFFYPPGSRHDVIAGPAGCEYRWITVDGPLAGALPESFGLVPPWPRRPGPAPVEVFTRLQALVQDPSLVAERAAVDAAWSLFSAAAGAAAGGASGDGASERLRRALAERFADPSLSVERLARDLGIDRSVLSRGFRRAFGVAPKPYLQMLRVQRAMALLAGSDLPVTEIAARTGFAAPGYFARAFRRAVGVPPLRFRKER